MGARLPRRLECAVFRSALFWALLGTVLGITPSARANTPKPDRAVAPLCAAARATLAKTGFTEDGKGSFRAAGTWQASGGASGVFLDFRIDGDRYAAESQRGAAGAWVYADRFTECGRHTARIYVFPVVTAGGRDVICLGQGRSVPGAFVSDCLPTASIVGCEWSCQPGPPAACRGTCTGRATGDPLGYVPFWGRDGGGYQPGEGEGGGERGRWTERITCAPGQRVSFKVRGHAGTGGWSPVVEVPCGPAKP